MKRVVDVMCPQKIVEVPCGEDVFMSACSDVVGSFVVRSIKLAKAHASADQMTRL